MSYDSDADVDNKWSKIELCEVVYIRYVVFESAEVSGVSKYSAFGTCNRSKKETFLACLEYLCSNVPRVSNENIAGLPYSAAHNGPIATPESSRGLSVQYCVDSWKYGDHLNVLPISKLAKVAIRGARFLCLDKHLARRVWNNFRTSPRPVWRMLVSRFLYFDRIFSCGVLDDSNLAPNLSRGGPKR